MEEGEEKGADEEIMDSGGEEKRAATGSGWGMVTPLTFLVRFMPKNRSAESALRRDAEYCR